MTAGLFAISCPECGGELASEPGSTTGTCLACERSYLTRFGHLIPIEFHHPEPDSAVVPVRLG